MMSWLLIRRFTAAKCIFNERKNGASYARFVDRGEATRATVILRAVGMTG